MNHSTDGTLQQLNVMLAEEERLLLCTTDGEDKQDMMHYKVQYWINVWTYQTGHEGVNIEDLVDRYITGHYTHYASIVGLFQLNVAVVLAIVL